MYINKTIFCLSLILLHTPLTNGLFGIDFHLFSTNRDSPFDQWELIKELGTNPKNFAITLDTISKDVTKASLSLENNFFNNDEYGLCVQQAIEPLYKSCMSTEATKSGALKSGEKSKISIDLLLCELKSMFQNTFDESNSTSALTNYTEKNNDMNKSIHKILTMERMCSNTDRTRVNLKMYKEIFELIKENNNLWTTYTLKNEKIEKLCNEFSQPLQKFHFENIIKHYAELLQNKIDSNNNNTLIAIRDLQAYLQIRMEEISDELKSDIKEEIKHHMHHLRDRINYLNKNQKEIMSNFTMQLHNFTSSNKQTLKNMSLVISTSLQKQKDEIDTFVKESFILKKEYFYLSKIFSNTYKLCLFMFKYKFILAAVAVIYWKYKTIISLIVLMSIGTYLIAADLINYFELENLSEHIFNETLPQIITRLPKIVLVTIVIKKVPQFWVFKKRLSILFLYIVDVFLICLGIHEQKKATSTLITNIELNGELLILTTAALNLYFKSWASIKIKIIISLFILLFVVTTMIISEYKFI
ncbi:uncharacterized protein HGUI_03880 [Hanseniaspora guilliermondii]|uniref:Karyogamy protein 5 n=1 Tax=Hanseniaspora guilliermondii TaxID=56406 RepID=A0A1L0D3E4_9ASCO|nr:uncharacterized protein HGUI_03880 [Hanseniaspora guilliermondii]